MAFTLKEQILHSIQEAKQPLLVLPHSATVDDFSCAITLSKLFEKLGKRVEIATSGGSMPKSLHFLSEGLDVRGDLSQLKKMTIRIDTKDTHIDEFRYDKEGEALIIHLLPKSGIWEQDDVQVETSTYRFDLVLTIGAQDLHALGNLYELYGDFFKHTPIINIDHRSDNEHFGHINLVDITAVSNTEICHDLFCDIDESLITEEIATILLTGMIHKTKSFRAPNISPKTLKVAGNLIAKGADRDRIVRELYKTRSLETLRLWGRALARLKADDTVNLTWTLLTKQDFSAAGASADALEHIVDELISTTPKTDVAVILYEAGHHIDAFIHAERPYDALSLSSHISGLGTREWAKATTRFEDIVEAEASIIPQIRQKILDTKKYL
jgi:phosphoesterase RecJ-like protein